MGLFSLYLSKLADWTSENNAFGVGLCEYAAFIQRFLSFLAKLCIYLFFGLQILVLLIGGQGRFIIENGVQSLGKMFQNFIGLSTYMDPVRGNNFPQDWTIYYWAYWMVWCICAPFFIGNISRGRTIKQVVLGGYVFGVGSTISSFVILGNYGLGAQIAGKGDFIAQYAESGDLYTLIISIVKTMPAAPVILIITRTRNIWKPWRKCLKISVCQMDHLFALPFRDMGFREERRSLIG